MMHFSNMESMAILPPRDRAEILDNLSEEECAALLHDWGGFLARPNQLAPEGMWDIWLVLSGRGWGKTRTGVEWVKSRVLNGASRIALVAETSADARDVLVEGHSGILSIYPEADRPLYEPSKRRLTWPNGAVGTLYNATEPDQLRGPQHDTALCDEVAKWKYARATWDQLQFGLRLGDDPRVVATTTPRPIELIKAIVAGEEGEVVVTRGSTEDNKSNLASKFLKKVTSRYAGTRLGRQELSGEILGDIPNAIFTISNIDTFRVKKMPEDIDRIVVAVDPAVTNTKESNEHGIVAVGRFGKEAVVLKDASIGGSPEEWARQAIAVFDDLEADAVVVEVNQGGDMVASTLRTVRSDLPIIEVHATRGKHVRAEPVASLYEQGRVHHLGAFVDLETQMSMMTNAGFEGDGSPDRVDALVWAVTELLPGILRAPKQEEDLTIPRLKRLS